MKVFISWSGEESHAVAMIMRDELPVIINAVKPFVSSEDIAKGSPWFQNIAAELENSSFGIVCLSNSNLDNKWILFEAGALAGKLTKKRVAPVLLDLTPEEVSPPLGQLQLTSLQRRDDFFKLLLSLNNELAPEHAVSEATLKKAFEIWWPPFTKRINERLASLPKSTPRPVERTDRELLNELLTLTRSIIANQPRRESILSKRLRSLSSAEVNGPQFKFKRMADGTLQRYAFKLNEESEASAEDFQRTHGSDV